MGEPGKAHTAPMAPKLKDPKLKWDIDDGPTYFRHRIVLLDNDMIVHEGLWTTFRGIAELEFEGRIFIACTAYYEGNLFPTEEIVEVRRNPSRNAKPLVEKE